jgi:hypothetical protein
LAPVLMWLMSALTPAVLATSYRFSVWMRGDSFSSSDSGCPMPPAAPVGPRRVSGARTAAAHGVGAALRTHDADLDAVRRLQARRTPRQLRLLARDERRVSARWRGATPKKRNRNAPATQRRWEQAAPQARSGDARRCPWPRSAG